MATQLWNQEIDKTVDWGGDQSTGNAPVSGKYVQKFIKDTLAQKFGYLKYDSDQNKYYIFADEADYNTWVSNPSLYADLRLAIFDAPAPASISTKVLSELNSTILSSDIAGRSITFQYTIKDSAGNFMYEAVSVRVQVTNNGVSQTFTMTYEADLDTYETGTQKTISIEKYLKVGTNNITVTITGASSQASTTFTVRCTVVELSISTGWDNTKPVEYDSTITGTNVYDLETGNVLSIPLTVKGQGTKYLELYVNGEAYKVTDKINSAYSKMVSCHGDLLGAQETVNTSLVLFLTDESGRLLKGTKTNEDGTTSETTLFKDGKNTIQIRFFVNDTNGVPIYSKNLYYEFVVNDKNEKSDYVFVLYKQEIDEIFDDSQMIEFSTMQYSSTSFDYSVASSSNRSIGLTFTLYSDNGDNEFNSMDEILEVLYRSINSGEVQTFTYNFLTSGKVFIQITTDLTDNYGNPMDTMIIAVDIAKSSAGDIAISDDGLIVELNARNRSNSEPNPATWSNNIVGTTINPVFNNIYWNESAGWLDNALLLNNGATLELPYNFFSRYQQTTGLTIELTFEMVNVQDEDSVMVSFESANNNSKIIMTASEAKIMDNDENYVYTKYNANTKIKLAFVINPYTTNLASLEGNRNQNNMFICINGILDKCDSYKGNILWNNVSNPKMVIGNAEGKAGIKLYSVRVYNKALSLDDELTNFIAESSDILEFFERNNIYETGTSSPSMDIVKNIVPTIVLYGDVKEFNESKNKKDNWQFDMEFYDPTDPERDFYARGMWISNQGTSSLSYPKRNLRPYFGKTRDGNTKDKTAEYYTEVYLGAKTGENSYGNFVHGSVNDESTLGHFYTNAKSCSDGYHKLYNKEQAEKLQDTDKIQIFYAITTTTGEGENAKTVKNYYPCKVGVDDVISGTGTNATHADTWYIQAYKEVKQFAPTDNVWKFLSDLRLSGVKVYTCEVTNQIANPYSGDLYPVSQFKKVSLSKPLNENTTYYLDQAQWKQYEKSGYTKVWTFKTDYAESSMCNNAGVGRLWGDAMKNFAMDGGYPGRTNAQTAIGNIQTKEDQKIDIRTSCDGKPCVMFICDLKYDEDGVTPLVVDGKRQYGTPYFAGLYNIMTDKSSTPLFGFENIYDTDGTLLYKADRTECWECLSNATEYGLGLTLASDSESVNDEGDRPIWGTYESRWPDVAEAAHTHNLEGMWRFINFCKPAVNYLIGDNDGYTLSPYRQVSGDELEKLWNQKPQPLFYSAQEVSGNMVYDEIELDDISSVEDMVNRYGNIYIYDANYDFHNAKTVLSGKTIEGHIYIGRAATWDAKHGTFQEDVQFDAERVEDPANGVEFGDDIAGSSVEEDYYTKVYLTRSGSTWKYTNEFGNEVTYTGSVDTDEYEKDKSGKSYAGETYMKYFSEKKYDWFNIPRLAAYYVYLMRFAAADQFVKNSMLTTEDGQHYYFINYDNDTVLGVRNDGNMVFHWNIDRYSYDDEKNSFCLAGNKSVLWNLLENDTDFMNIVKQVDNAMFTSNVLSAKIALDMFNVKQEGTWGERMYNINEEYKYLSQWDGTDAKYLKFIHGSANQYRSWFIENRFNLYDSLWESGDYLTTNIAMRMDTTANNRTTPMFDITAARQNKFFLSNSDGNYKNVDAWKIELQQGETGSWIGLYSIYGNSSPWTLYGADKIKSLDFSKSTGIYDLQYLSFNEAGTNWVGRKGSLMTDLIIGNNDEYFEVATHRYTNITEEPQFIGEVEIAPGEHYDSTTQVGGLNLDTDWNYELMPKTVCNVTALGALNMVYSLETVDIRNCSKLEETNLPIDNLSNLHVFRAIGSNITSFIPAIGVTLTEVSLPKNRIQRLELNNVTLRRGESDANVWNYTPDSSLVSLALNNLNQPEEEFINIVDFINTWIEVYSSSHPEASLKNLTLALEGVDLQIGGTIEDPTGFEFVKKLKELNLTSFTGTIYLGEINQEIYNELVELYADERPFDSSSALQFTADAATFWEISGGKLVELPSAQVWGQQAVNSYYELVHGETFSFKATNFGAANITKQNYRFRAMAGSVTNPSANNASWLSNWYNQNSPLSDNNFNMSMVVNQNAQSTFLSDISSKVTATNTNANNTRWVQIEQLTDTNGPTGVYIYLQINKFVSPSGMYFTVDGEKVTSLEFLTNNETKEVTIHFENAETMTAQTGLPELYFDNANVNTDTSALEFSNIVRIADPAEGAGKFTVKAKIQPNSVDKTVKVTVPVVKSQVNEHSVSAELGMKVTTVRPTGIRFVENVIEGVKYDTTEINGKNATKLTINCQITKDGIKFPLEPYAENGDTPNLPILSFSKELSADEVQDTNVISIPTIESDGNGNYYLLVKSVSASTVNANAYDAEYNMNAAGYFGYSTWSEDDKERFAFTFDFRLDASIIYPDAIKLLEDGNEVNSFIINGSDDKEKTIVVEIKPYNTLKSDDVTVDYTIENVDIKYVDGKMSNGTTSGGADYEFLTYTFEDNNLSITLHKAVDSDDNGINEFQDGKINISADIIYTKAGETSLTKANLSIKDVYVGQTISSTNNISACVPYNLSIDNVTYNDCPWYLIDNNNNYYKIDKGILEQLQTANKINSLVGLAKRVPYSFMVNGGNADSTNDFNNASMVWDFDPELKVWTNTKSVKDSKTAISDYYRPICFPLANWKFKKSMFENVNENPENNGSSIFERPAFFVAVSRIGDEGNTVVTTLLGGTTSKLNAFNRLAQISLHSKLNSLNLETLGRVHDSTFIGPMAAWDNKALFKTIFDGEIPKGIGSWNNNQITPLGTEYRSSIAFNMNAELGVSTNSPYKLSGIYQTYHHFNIFDDTLSTDKEGQGEHNATNIKCYTASMFELLHIFGFDWGVSSTNAGQSNNTLNGWHGETFPEMRKLNEIFSILESDGYFDNSFITAFIKYIDNLPGGFNNLAITSIYPGIDNNATNKAGIIANGLTASAVAGGSMIRYYDKTWSLHNVGNAAVTTGSQFFVYCNDNEETTNRWEKSIALFMPLLMVD